MGGEQPVLAEDDKIATAAPPTTRVTATAPTPTAAIAADIECVSDGELREEGRHRHPMQNPRHQSVGRFASRYGLGEGMGSSGDHASLSAPYVLVPRACARDKMMVRALVPA